MSKERLHSNRDLYIFVAGLREVSAYQDRSLEEYLRALWRLGSLHKDKAALPLTLFSELLERAFREDPPPFDPSWRRVANPNLTKPPGYEGWEQTILYQVVDLRDMADAGMLRNEMRYFGIKAPRENDWYNFDPLTYLECATAGTFEGFREGDGRIKLNPSTPDPPITGLTHVGWDEFRDFLWAGQYYE